MDEISKRIKRQEFEYENSQSYLFCDYSRKIPSTKIYEDEYVFAFCNINPPPTHILAVEEHIASMNKVNAENSALSRDIRLSKIAAGRQQATACLPLRSDTCRAIHHLHFHILGGTQLADRMA